MPERSAIINLTAGPSQLPDDVLQQAALGLLNYEGTGIGIVELSHRSPEFAKLTKDLEESIRNILEVPPTHSILFTQGGGNAQFSAVVYNLLARHRLLHPTVKEEDITLDYVVTGSWSKKAAEEARQLCGRATVNIIADGRQHSPNSKFDRIPPHESFSFSKSPAYIYYCENETVDGVQFSDIESSPASFPFHLLPASSQQGDGVAAPIPLVADYSSSFMSRPIKNLDQHALIYAGAQKNLGPSGLTILIVRKDLLVDTKAAAALGAAPTPITMSYKVLADNGSLYNTPPMFSMYVSLLVVRYFLEKGGLKPLGETNSKKQAKVYEALDEGISKGVFTGTVADKESRSWMNVTFLVNGGSDVEKEFVKKAEEKGLRGVKGHRSVGGIRLSLYNAVSEQQVDTVVEFLKSFIAEKAATNQN